MGKFDIYDYTSLYLADRQRKWIEDTYLANSDIAPVFKSMCEGNEGVVITPNAVFVAKYLLEKQNMLLFPWVIISRTGVLGEGNWRMLFMEGGMVLYSKVPIATVVDRIKRGMNILLEPHLDSSYYELTVQ